MTATMDDSTPPALDPIPLLTRPPEGHWVRDAAHARLPRTALNDALGEAMARINRRNYAEFGIPFETSEYQKIGGWDYVRLAPLGGKEPPRLPAWLAGLALRLVPAMRRRSAAAVSAIRTDRAGALLGQWVSEWRPELITRTAELREVDIAGLDDTRLDEHLGHVLALLNDGLDIHFKLHLAIALPLAELAFTCRELLGWDETQAFRLLVGTSEMSTAPARALAELAGAVAARPAVRRLVERNAPLDEVLAPDQTFAAHFAAYLRDYGHRALSY
jgi:pyruvate,water dikinase